MKGSDQSREGIFLAAQNRALSGMRFRENSFSRKSDQEEEDEIPRNQLALFGLCLRRVPERLQGDGNERLGSNPEGSTQNSLEPNDHNFR